MDFFASFLDKFALPLSSGIAGVVVTVWKLQKDLSSRVDDLYRFRDVDYARERSELLKSVSAIRTDVKKEIESLRSELQVKSKELAQLKLLQTKAAERASVLESQFEQLSRSIESMDEQFKTFAISQNEQWQAINKSLGQLEGFIRGALQKDR